MFSRCGALAAEKESILAAIEEHCGVSPARGVARRGTGSSVRVRASEASSSR